MDNKRFKMFLSIILIVAILVSMSFYIFSHLTKISSSISEDYVPQEEISDEQFRSTFVKLYFKSVASNDLQYESRYIDSKDLLVNPYLTLMNLLLAGPSVEGLESAIPGGTVLHSIELSGDIVIVDLSAEFIASVSDVNVASAMVYSIVNTLTELTEVNAVQFLIDGNSDAVFPECNFSLKSPFVRK